MISNSTYENTQDTADKATRSLDRALESGQAAARRASERASEMATRGMDAVRDGSQHLRDRALRVTDDSVAYIKHEPVKSIIYAAVAGAALMGVVSLLSRRRY